MGIRAWLVLLKLPLAAKSGHRTSDPEADAKLPNIGDRLGLNWEAKWASTVCGTSSIAKLCCKPPSGESNGQNFVQVPVYRAGSLYTLCWASTLATRRKDVRMTKKFLFMATLLMHGSVALAQSSDLNCRDFRGQPVIQMAANIPDGAAARSLPSGQGVIYFNPQIMSAYSQLFRDFVFAHECAHHTLGHGAIAPVNEDDADCWAIRTLVFQLGLPPDRIVEIQQQIAVGGGTGDWSHAPGVVRAQRLPICLM